jgi:drug/metabolite transporter (DMT)-like permease
MSVALGFSMRRSRDALVGAFATALSGFCVCAVVAAIGREWGGEIWPYMLAGLLAPGGAQLLFVLGVREAGPARASVVVGAAPLVAVTIAITALGEPAQLPLLAGAVLSSGGWHWSPSATAGTLPRDRAALRVRLHRALRNA